MPPGISGLTRTPSSRSAAHPRELQAPQSRDAEARVSQVLCALIHHFYRFLQIFTDFYRSLEGSFSAGSTATIATKYSFCSIFRDLQNYLANFVFWLKLLQKILNLQRCEGMIFLKISKNAAKWVLGCKTRFRYSRDMALTSWRKSVKFADKSE